MVTHEIKKDEEIFLLPIILDKEAWPQESKTNALKYS